jgi:hypothetical protein
LQQISNKARELLYSHTFDLQCGKKKGRKENSMKGRKGERKKGKRSRRNRRKEVEPSLLFSKYVKFYCDQS